jgi:LytS/YehU family sensor histidine kinase
MRDTSSTVAQEIELARAYLAIVRIRLGNRLDVAIDVPPNHADARLPPMMLLPLVDHAVVHGLAPANAMATISIKTQISDDRLRLIIVDNGAGFVPETEGSGLASIRERLDALYGEQATLNLEPRR